MKFFCSHCGQRIEAGETPAGISLTCPVCGGAASVPAAIPAGPDIAPPLQQERLRANLLITGCVLAMLLGLLFLLMRPPQSGWGQAARGVIFGRHLTAMADGGRQEPGEATSRTSQTSARESETSSATTNAVAGTASSQNVPVVAESPPVTPGPTPASPATGSPSSSSDRMDSAAVPSLPLTNRTALATPRLPELRGGVPLVQTPTNRISLATARVPQPRGELPLAQAPATRFPVETAPAQAAVRRTPVSPSARQPEKSVAARTPAPAQRTPPKPTAEQPDREAAAPFSPSAEKPNEQATALARTYDLVRERQTSAGQPDRQVTAHIEATPQRTPLEPNTEQPNRPPPPRPAPTLQPKAERAALSPTISQSSPRFFGERGQGTKLVYVIDRSDSMKTDSMGGSRLNAARQELISSLHSLPADASFYVFFYDSTFEAMPAPGLLPATSTNVARIVQWIETQTPRGDTDPSEAMRRALDLKPDTIWLLSDGQFGSGVSEQIRRANPGHRVMIHTIAFHDQSGKSTLEQIARENSGNYRFVPPTANATTLPVPPRTP